MKKQKPIIIRLFKEVEEFPLQTVLLSAIGMITMLGFLVS